MMLSEKQLKTYQENGFLILENYLSKAEIDVIKKAASSRLKEDKYQRLLEASGDIKAYFGIHQANKVLHDLGQLPRLVEPVKQILESNVYIHQSKLNPKVALAGEELEWHTDFWYWHREDGMPTPRAVTVGIFLDNVNDFNGPMLIIPGSHRQATQLESSDRSALRTGSRSEHDDNEPFWMQSVIPKYPIDKDGLAQVIAECGIVSVKGTAGLVIFFHSCVLHASLCNMSPWDRYAIFVSYNSVENGPIKAGKPRPRFIAESDFSPIVTVSDSALLEAR